jgi:hypothetical protein
MKRRVRVSDLYFKISTKQHPHTSVLQCKSITGRGIVSTLISPPPLSKFVAMCCTQIQIEMMGD